MTTQLELSIKALEVAKTLHLAAVTFPHNFIANAQPIVLEAMQWAAEQAKPLADGGLVGPPSRSLLVGEYANEEMDYRKDAK